jgi:hypothetical protein
LLRDIYYPIETNSDTVLIPAGHITRVDIEPNPSVNIVNNNSGWLWQVQKFVTKQTKQMIFDEAQSKLDGISVAPLTSAETNLKNQQAGVIKYLNEHNNVRPFILTSKNNAAASWNNIPVILSVKQLRDSIVIFSQSQNESRALVIFDPAGIEAVGQIKSVTIDSVVDKTLDSGGNSASKPETSYAVTNSKQNTVKPAPAYSDGNIQTYFDRLSDSHTSYSSKNGLAGNLTSYFNDATAKVIVVGINNTEVNDMPAKDFIETLRITNQQYLFINGVKEGNLYTSIRVRAN